MDERITLKDKAVRAINLNDKNIVFADSDNWVGRGGTCLVYRAEIQGVNNVGQALNKKIILKEFYPILSKDMSNCITRDNTGKVVISNEARASFEYKKKRERFEALYDRFVLFSSKHSINNYVVKTLERIEVKSEVGEPLLYIIMDYDNAENLDSFIESSPSLYDFFYMIKKAAEAILRIHKSGHLHLDISPSNLLFFREDNYVRVMDTDSIVKKCEVDGAELLYSAGYTAPEVLEGDTWTLREYGEQADIFSLGAIIYRFLMGKRLEYTTEDMVIDANKSKYYLEKYLYEVELERILLYKEECPRYVIKMIKELLENTIALNIDLRYENVGEMISKIDEILKYHETQKIYLQKLL